MLDQLLNLLRESGTKQVKEIASEMKITPNLVLLMLEDLEKKGVIQKVNFRSNPQCAKCILSHSCKVNADQRIWVLIK
jgi:predicted ArsR family transcriptional regulator